MTVVIQIVLSIRSLATGLICRRERLRWLMVAAVVSSRVLMVSLALVLLMYDARRPRVV